MQITNTRASTRKNTTTVKRYRPYFKCLKITLTSYFLPALMFFSGLSFISNPVMAEEAKLKLSDVKRGSLLFQSETTGDYQLAPTLMTDVKVDITGMIARVTVKQSFKNHQAYWVEGIYVFPLPDNAAVDKMRIEVGERVIQAKISEREEAKKTYQAAKRGGKKAALIEQERANLFTNSIANIAPNETVHIVIEYQQIIAYDNGEFTLRFPMAITPRYIPGESKNLTESMTTNDAVTIHEPQRINEKIDQFNGHGWAVNTSQVKDASRITPLMWSGAASLSLNPVTLQIRLNSGFSLRYLKSLYHPIHRQSFGENRTLIQMQDGEIASDRDFVLVWKPEPEQQPKAALFSEEKDGDLYHLLMVLPPKSLAEENPMSREVIFIIDTSGSMDGTSIKQAKSALTLAISRLKAEDHFNILSFNDTTDVLFPQARTANKRNRRLALQYANSLASGGGTEMKGALQAALLDQRSEKTVRQVIFLTDGSVGNEADLFQFIQEHVNGSRLFTIGIGSAPNSHFMRKAAQFGRGSFTYIGDLTEVKSKMDELFQKLGTSMMTDIRVQLDDAHESYPSRVPDLYFGEPLIITTKTSTANQKVVIQGEREGQQWRSSLDLSQATQGTGIATLWAREKIESLMDEHRESNNKDSVKRKIIEVALQHHLVSKYTSLVAVEKIPSRPIEEGVETQTVPVNLPQGQIKTQLLGEHAQTATWAPVNLLIGVFLLLIALLVLMRKTEVISHEG